MAVAFDAFTVGIVPNLCHLKQGEGWLTDEPTFIEPSLY